MGVLDTVERSPMVARSTSFMENCSNSVAGRVVKGSSKIVSNAIQSATEKQTPEIRISGGSLPGMTALASPQVSQNCAPRRRVKITVPAFENQRVHNGQEPTFVVALATGERVGVKVPKGVKPGQEVHVNVRDYSKMLTSTLQVPPSGAKVMVQKPIQWETARQSKQENPDTGALLACAQHRLLKQAHSLGCNAVLGISFNVASNSTEQSKPEMVVTAYGTPCIIAAETDIDADGKPARDDDLESCVSFADTATEADTDLEV